MEKKQHITVVFTDDFTDDSHLSYVHPSCCDCFPCHLLWYIVNKVIITQQQASSEAWEDWKSRCQSSHHFASFIESCTLMTSGCANGWVWGTILMNCSDIFCGLMMHIIHTFVLFWKAPGPHPDQVRPKVPALAWLQLLWWECFILVVASKQQHWLTER